MILLQIIFFIIFATNGITGKPTVFRSDQKCLNTCPETRKDLLNIHIVPHSHDDVGWLKTVDQYYYGSRSNIQHAGVQYILDSVISELQLNPDRKFIQVETAFFWKWWLEQNEHTRNIVKQLVDNDQLEITGGGWSMNDEAVTHYQSTIDQFTWGLRRINDTFGECGRPNIGWQIDPFGHSREMASIFAQMGFDGLFFARLDYQDKEKRQREKKLELVWRGSANLGNATDLFTGALYAHYSPPPGFCFDVHCGDDPIIDDKSSPDYNVEDRVRAFVDHCKNQANSYKSNNIMLTMGDDFNYEDARMWYKNLDKLIKYVNELKGDEVRAFYSTPACYVQRIHDTNETWSTKTDDFFPYASDSHSYWTGFFTSRPSTKFLERQGNNLLQVCKQLEATPKPGDQNFSPVESEGLIALREAMGVFQHHDAITGTEKQHVTFDYVRSLSGAIDQCEEIVTSGLSKLVTSGNSDLNLKVCPLKISACDVSENSKKFVTVLYNPGSHAVDKYVRLPVTGESYSVTDNEGNTILNQIVPLSKGVLNIPGRESSATNELVFLASNIPPMGIKVFHIAKENNKRASFVSKEVKDQNIEMGEYEGFNIEYLYYDALSSGAYRFRPEPSAPTPLKATGLPRIFFGELGDEIQESYGPWVHSVTRFYRNSTISEIDWIVGPIPIDNAKGKEVIIRINTNAQSKGVFYTDSNGRELLRRERNKRDTWDVQIEEPAAANYYPITSRLTLVDDERRHTLFTDRAQGGSSLADGQLELMLHRRLLQDDGYGVGEALNETSYETETGSNGLVVRGTVTFHPNTTAANDRKFAAQSILAPLIFVASIDKVDSFDLKNIKFDALSGLNEEESFPSNVQILTLEPWKNGQLLLRLEHIFEKNEDPILSQSACVNIENLFTQFRIVNVRETTLDGNQWIEDMDRLKWKTEGNLDNDEEPRKIIQNYKCSNNGANKFDIVLDPMQIRTFVVDITQSYAKPL